MASGRINDPYKGREYWQRISIPDTHSQYSNNYLEFNKRGHTVEISLNFSVKGTIDGVEELRLGTIDYELRPMRRFNVGVIDLNTYQRGMAVNIDISGNVVVYIYGTAGSVNAQYNFTYLTDN